MSTIEYATRPPAQERLAELLHARAARVGRRPERGPAGDEAETTVLVLLRTVDLAELVAGARRFAAELTEQESARWQWSWTRTRFLFGNPANLAGGVSARVTAPGGSTAWLGPYPDGRLPGWSRLLKPVTGRLPRLPESVVLPPAGGPPGAEEPRELRVAVRDLTFAQYLVHLHHTLAEAALTGRLAPDETLRLVHRQDLGTETASGDPGYARVHHAPGDGDRLRLYTWLSPDHRR